MGSAARTCRNRMTPAARLSAAIEILQDIQTLRRPASEALKAWGLAHRFAGSKDRAAIASLAYDALRRQASAAHLMRNDTPRAQLLGTLVLQRGMDLQAISNLCSGDRFAPAPLSEDERRCIAKPDLSTAPAHVQADSPDWLWPYFKAAYGEKAVAEVSALAGRAPVDIRVNSLKSLRDVLRPKLLHLHPANTPWSPVGLRFDAGEGGRGPALQALPEFLKGHFEIQDEGSQLVAAMSGVEPGEQVVDLCAGGGGKTLALAALMNNSGQVFASDIDSRRLAPIHARLDRAGVRNVQVRTPRGRDDDQLSDLKGKIDLVLVDAPCTGTGVWRRNPDAKWRIRPGALQQRIIEQNQVLERAAGLVRPGGRIAYITCSMLHQENDARVIEFLSDHNDFTLIDPRGTLSLAPDALAEREDILSPRGQGLQLSPHRTGTDGFFLAIVRKKS
jgi:16S rRNA (cytosine967-C5)-methyltransferase